MKRSWCSPYRVHVGRSCSRFQTVPWNARGLQTGDNAVGRECAALLPDLLWAPSNNRRYRMFGLEKERGCGEDVVVRCVRARRRAKLKQRQRRKRDVNKHSPWRLQQPGGALSASLFQVRGLPKGKVARDITKNVRDAHVKVLKTCNAASFILHLPVLRGVGLPTPPSTTMDPTTICLESAEAQAFPHDPREECSKSSTIATQFADSYGTER